MANTLRLVDDSRLRALWINLAVLVVLATFARNAKGQITSSAASIQLQNQPNASAGSQPTPAQKTPTGVGPILAPEDLSRMKLGPGSMIDVHVFEEPDLDGSYRLNSDGFISMPFAGNIDLTSMSLQQAEAAIRAKLKAADVLTDSHVVVNINEYSARNVVVMGEVSAPGRYPILGSQKLNDVLATAGGQTVLAGNEIVIHRADQPAQVTEVVHVVKYQSSAESLSVEINPGDTVTVKRAGVVYVLGAVNRPGGYIMQEFGKLDVAQALALAGGPIAEAKIGDMRVIHKQDNGTLTETPVEYKKISKGQVQALSLAAEDIVYVPVSAIKTALLRGTQVVASAASAAIYAAN